jgi:hypothetical protein
MWLPVPSTSLVMAHYVPEVHDAHSDATRRGLENYTFLPPQVEIKKSPLEGYRRFTFMMLDAEVVAVSSASVCAEWMPRGKQHRICKRFR